MAQDIFCQHDFLFSIYLFSLNHLLAEHEALIFFAPSKIPFGNNKKKDLCHYLRKVTIVYDMQ